MMTAQIRTPAWSYLGMAMIIPVLLLPSGCSAPNDAASVIEEGVIFSLECEKPDGSTWGFTRVNVAGAVPGGNGSWNVDAYGKLTQDFLIVSYPQKKDLGPRIIPTRVLLEVQFGDGGIKQVDEGQPAAP